MQCYLAFSSQSLVPFYDDKQCGNHKKETKKGGGWGVSEGSIALFFSFG